MRTKSVNKKNKMLGITLSTAAALAFATAPLAAPVDPNECMVKCFGLNACKGKAGCCKTAVNNCKGQNKCKGLGYFLKTEAECQRLGGTTKEPKPR